MSNECEEETICLAFVMPFGETLEIRSSKEVGEFIGNDEEVEGVEYRVYWNDVALPWFTKTLLQASAIAFGCQWGAHEMVKKQGKNEQFMVKNQG